MYSTPGLAQWRTIGHAHSPSNVIGAAVGGLVGHFTDVGLDGGAQALPCGIIRAQYPTIDNKCKASLFVFIGATVLLVVGIIEMGTAVWQALTPAGQAHAAESVSVRVAVIEAVDVILVATVLFLIAFGLYQLFVDPTLRSTLPAWLQISAISNLEVRLAGMVVTVLSIIALTRALESHGDAASTGVGFEIAAIIAAISLFLYQESKHHPPDKGPEE
jgi:uncharacterized membrane protein YqhA